MSFHSRRIELYKRPKNYTNIRCKSTQLLYSIGRGVLQDEASVALAINNYRSERVNYNNNNIETKTFGAKRFFTPHHPVQRSKSCN